MVKTIDTQVPTPVNNPPIEKITTKAPDDAVPGTQDIEGPVATKPIIQAPIIKTPGEELYLRLNSLRFRLMKSLHILMLKLLMLVV